jgi:DNA-directed RNA polymerase specialized sigma24 family protein
MTDRPPDHVLESPWPPFLDWLDSDPRRAQAAFADFGYRLLRVFPPRIFAGLTPEQREEAVQEVLVHCIANDCRVLRLYKPSGKPFAAWLLFVTSNKVRDLFFRRKRKDDVSLDPEMEARIAAPDEPPGDLLREGIVRRELGALGEKCRLLLSFFAEGLAPREMAELAGRLLGSGDYTNKQAGDDLAYCRRLLRRRLEQAGVTGT